MPRGDKARYTDKQKRQAEHIEESMEKRGMSEKEAGRRAWMTVNKIHKGEEKPGGGGDGKTEKKKFYGRGEKKGGGGGAGRPKMARSISAKKAALTRKQR